MVEQVIKSNICQYETDTNNTFLLENIKKLIKCELLQKNTLTKLNDIVTNAQSYLLLPNSVYKTHTCSDYSMPGFLYFEDKDLYSKLFKHQSTQIVSCSISDNSFILSGVNYTVGLQKYDNMRSYYVPSNVLNNAIIDVILDNDVLDERISSKLLV